MKTQLEIPNFNTETVLMSNQTFNTKVFSLNENEKELWKHLPNVVFSTTPHLNGYRPQVCVVIPAGHKAYSHGSVIRNGKLVFTYRTA